METFIIDKWWLMGSCKILQGVINLLVAGIAGIIAQIKFIMIIRFSMWDDIYLFF